MMFIFAFYVNPYCLELVDNDASASATASDGWSKFATTREAAARKA